MSGLPCSSSFSVIVTISAGVAGLMPDPGASAQSLAVALLERADAALLNAKRSGRNRLIVAGLDVTFEARPFEPMPSLAALAESVTRLTAVCSVCGADAAFHERVVAADAVTTGVVAGGAGAGVREARPELVGGAESYVARCRHHLAVRPWDGS